MSSHVLSLDSASSGYPARTRISEIAVIASQLFGRSSTALSSETDPMLRVEGELVGLEGKKLTCRNRGSRPRQKVTEQLGGATGAVP